MTTPRAIAAVAFALAAFSGFTAPALAGSPSDDAAQRYGLSQSTNAGTLLADPRAQAALQKYAPQVASDPKQMQAVSGMSMGQLEALARDMLPADMLAKLEEKLAGMGR